MLQNLLGTHVSTPVSSPASGLARSPAGPEGRGEGLAKNLDNSLGSFDKSLISNDPNSPAVQLSGLIPVSGGELTGDSASWPDELLGSLRASLQVLLNELYPGKEFPLVGNSLPDAASMDLSAALGRIAGLAPELESELNEILGADVAELDASGLAGLARQLDAVFAQLAAGLAGNSATAAPVAAAVATPQGLGLGLTGNQAPAAHGQVADSAQAVSRVLGGSAALEQVRSVLVTVRDVLRQVSNRAQPQVLTQAGASANTAQLAESGASSVAAGLAIANSMSKAFVQVDKHLATPAALVSNLAPASSAQAMMASAARGASELNPTRKQGVGLSGAMPLPLHAAVDQARSESVLPATLLPAAAALRTAALGAVGFELAPNGQTLEPLAAATQASAGLLQPAAAQSNWTPLAGAHTFTTSVGLPVVNGQWGSQIAQRITWLTGQGIKAADIHLNPPELGPMQVRIDSTENAARVTISAHNAMTREALEMQLPRLRDLFAEQGLELVDVDVENRDFAGGDSQSAASENDAGDDQSATPENGLTTDASRDPVRADDPSATAGDTIVLSYALVDAYA